MQDYKPFSLHNVLSRALSFITRDWVKKYLFKPTPESDLSILTSNQQVQHAFAGKLRTVSNSPPNSFSPFMLGNMNAYVLFIPAYCIEEISAGVMLKENSFGIKPPVPDSIIYKNTAYGRFVRNEDTGELCMVAMDDGSDHVDIMFITWDTDEHRHRCFMRFEKQKLLNAMFSDGLVNAVRVGESASFFVHVDEHRVCENCNPFGMGVCACQNRLHLTRPKHVLDFATITNNMKVLTRGSFVGTCVHSMFFNNVAAPFEPINVYGAMTSTDEPGIVPRLLSWSISSRIANSVLSPPWSLDFSNPAVLAAPTSTAEPLPTDPFDPAFLDVPEDAENASVPQNCFKSTSVTCAENRVGNGITQSNTSSLRSPCNSCEDRVQEGGSNVATLLPRRVPETRIEAGEFGISVHTVGESALLPAPSAAASDTSLPLSNALLRTGAEWQGQASILPRSEGPVYRMGSAMNVGIGLSVNEMSLRSGVGVFSGGENDKEAKALQRKLRNRESAARSNLRKQLLGKELKGKITKEVRKMEALQCRLKSLQEENKLLRSKVAGNSD